MDVKTLEYMGERVDKARKLRKAIDTIDERIKYLRTRSIGTVRFSADDDYIIINQGFMGLPDNSVVSLIKETAITCLESHRDQLQRELDEL